MSESDYLTGLTRRGMVQQLRTTSKVISTSKMARTSPGSLQCNCRFCSLVQRSDSRTSMWVPSPGSGLRSFRSFPIESMNQSLSRVNQTTKLEILRTTWQALLRQPCTIQLVNCLGVSSEWTRRIKFRRAPDVDDSLGHLRADDARSHGDYLRIVGFGCPLRGVSCVRTARMPGILLAGNAHSNT
jgi:hypothetical protein